MKPYSILLLGNDNIISTSFKVLIELISDENMEKNRTELVFKLGNKLIKFAHIINARTR